MSKRARVRLHDNVGLFGHVPPFHRSIARRQLLLELMRAHGYVPIGGPRQVQAVAADDLVAGRLHVSAGDPLLLLEGVTRDESGRGLEWFRVWHRQNTVFDVDASVTGGPDASATDLHTARSLVAELQDTLSELRRELEPIPIEPQGTRRELAVRDRSDYIALQ
ncbi:UTRA domain-containing protein [Williamsia sp. R60]